MMILRPDQEKVMRETREALRTSRRVLVQAPTGFGKTVLSATMFRNAAAKLHRTLFIVHRRELLDQTAATFDKVGIPYSFCATGYPFLPMADHLICSIDTLRNRIDKVGPRTLLGWDEAHHSAAASWAAVQKAFPEAYHLGFSATPERLDGKGLNGQFDSMVLGPTTRWLIDEGHLVNYRAYAPTTLDTSGLHEMAGDFNQREVAELIEGSKLLGDIIEHYRKLADGKRAVVFCHSVDAAYQLAANFRDAGITAAALDADAPKDKRDETIKAFRRGEVLVLTNVNLFSEGFDLPAMEAVIMARPTLSLAMFMQQCGRALRTSPGKTEAILIDHVGNFAQHGLPCFEREWDLAGRKKKAKAKPELATKQCPECFSVFEAFHNACPHCGHEAERNIGARQLELEERELREIDKAAMLAAKEAQKAQQKREQGMATSLPALVQLAKARGYKSPEQWAAHIWSGREAAKSRRAEQQFAAHTRGRY